MGRPLTGAPRKGLAPALTGRGGTAGGRGPARPSSRFPPTPSPLPGPPPHLPKPLPASRAELAPGAGPGARGGEEARGAATHRGKETARSEPQPSAEVYRRPGREERAPPKPGGFQFPQWLRERSRQFHASTPAPPLPQQSARNPDPQPGPRVPPPRGRADLPGAANPPPMQPHCTPTSNQQGECWAGSSRDGRGCRFKEPAEGGQH